jgi:Arc/MetJ family transcription regulator
MKITIELPDSDIQEICQITGLAKKGPAIRKLLSDTLQLQRRARTLAQFRTGEWSASLDGFEIARRQDRQHAQTLADAWQS